MNKGIASDQSRDPFVRGQPLTLAGIMPSGVSQTAWCREHGVSLANFGYWCDKLAVEARSASAAVLPIRLLKAVGYEARGKNLRKNMRKKRKAAHAACQGKKTGKMRGSLAR